MTEPASPIAAPVAFAWLASLAGLQIGPMPAGGVLFSVLMAWLNNMDKAPPGRTAGKHALYVLYQALCGCLAALALLKLPFFKGYGVADLGFSAAAPLATLGIPWVWENGKAIFGRFVNSSLEAYEDRIRSRRESGDGK